MSSATFVVDHMSWLRTIKWNERSLGRPLESKVCTHTPLLSANGVHGFAPGQQRSATVISPDPETYEVRADGVHLTCEPATVLPMAQRYFLY